jgi:hypothetical protein
MTQIAKSCILHATDDQPQRPSGWASVSLKAYGDHRLSEAGCDRHLSLLEVANWHCVEAQLLVRQLMTRCNRQRQRQPQCTNVQKNMATTSLVYTKCALTARLMQLALPGPRPVALPNT